MNNLFLMEAHRALLSRQVVILLELIKQGNLSKISLSTKQFISTLSDYLSLQEQCIKEIGGDSYMVLEAKGHIQVINDYVDDIYFVHVTEPDGEFVQIINRIVEAVHEKLIIDSEIFSTWTDEIANGEPSYNKLQSVA